ncbi:MAG: ABC transporter ATP-binding protein [Hydrogenibacillus sp.]|nr:ABC transporter ATP-binding protein [Hydrogenibacillus sp.]
MRANPDIESDVQRCRTDDETAVCVEAVTFSVSTHGGRLDILRGVDLSIPKGTLVMLLGRSGTGKTTLLNCLSGLENPTSGRIRLGNVDLTALSERARTRFRRTSVGIVFQAHPLVPHLTVAENIALTMRLAGVPRGSWKTRIDEALAGIGLLRRAEHFPDELSGGEQQRAAIARAIAHRPPFLFADEPTAELDSARAAEVIRLFRRLAHDDGLTIVMTTHDLSLLEFADEVYEMSDGRAVRRTSVPARAEPVVPPDNAS